MDICNQTEIKNAAVPTCMGHGEEKSSAVSTTTEITFCLGQAIRVPVERSTGLPALGGPA